MGHIGCIFCNVQSTRVVIEENGFKGLKCPQCGLIYISPRPSFNEIVNLYRKDNAHISAVAHISARYSKRLFARHHLRIIKSYINHGAVLELGAGAGYFLHEAKQMGFDPYGIEYNPIQAGFIRNILKIPCEESELGTTTFGGMRFDLVYHSDVISHLFDPLSEFRRMHAIMKKNSFLIFETGNLGEVHQRYFKYFECFQYPDHLFFFSTDNLRKLLEISGFELLKIYRYSIMPQLLLIRVITRLRQSLSKGKKVEDIERTGIVAKHDHHAPDNKIKKSLSITWNYLNYLLRLKIGYIVPKKNQPQTVIIVSRKIEKNGLKTRDG